MPSQILSTVQDSDPLIDIDEISVQLTPGNDLTFDVTLQVPFAETQPLDIFLLQDLSSSFNNDLNNLRATIPDLVDELQLRQSDIQYGIGSFIDYPEDGGPPSHYPYRLDLELTEDSNEFKAAVDSFQTISGGRGFPESQLRALLETANDFNTIGFREDALKIVLLATDADFYDSSDSSLYPSVEEVQQAFLANNLVPVFLLANFSSHSSDYQALAEPLGGTVVRLESDSANLVDAVTTGLDTVLENISIFEAGDDQDIVTFSPTEFFDVAPGDNPQVQVTLSADELDQNDTVTLQVPGYGETQINIDIENNSADENNGTLRGTKWNDLDGDGIRDSAIIIQGNPPDIVFTIDVSGSTEDPFIGTSVGDVNNDGIADTRLDAQLAGFISLNNQLNAQGYGDTANVSIIVFGSSAETADMNLSADGIQLTTSPNTDTNNNGISDVEDILSTIQAGALGVGKYTDFEDALQAASTVFSTIGTAGGDG